MRFRFAFGFLDQAIVSLGSILYLVAAAQGLAPGALGEYALSVASVVVVLSIVRSICGEPYLVRDDHTNYRSPASSMIGLTVVLSAVASTLFILLSLLGNSFSQIFIATAIALPGIVLQDSLRYIHIGHGNSKRLLIFDFLTTISNVIAIFLASSNLHSPVYVVLAWGGSSFFWYVLSSVMTSVYPSFATSFLWLKSGWKFSSSFAFEATLGAAVGYATTMVVAIFSSPSDVAALRAVVSIFGITSLVINFLRTTVVRELALMKSDNRNFTKIRWMLYVVMIFITTMMCILILVAPSWLGVSLFGSTWYLLVALVVPATINRTFASLSQVPTIFLRSIGVTWKAARVRMIVSVIGFGLGPVGAYFYGAPGALIAESIMYLLFLVFLSRLYSKEIGQGSS